MGEPDDTQRVRTAIQCGSVGHRDHSDRGASGNIAVKRIEKQQHWHVAASNSLPVVQDVDREATSLEPVAPEAVHGPTVVDH